jgi:hypothetical protein
MCHGASLRFGVWSLEFAVELSADQWLRSVISTTEGRRDPPPTCAAWPGRRGSLSRLRLLRDDSNSRCVRSAAEEPSCRRHQCGRGRPHTMRTASCAGSCRLHQCRRGRPHTMRTASCAGSCRLHQCRRGARTPLCLLPSALCLYSVHFLIFFRKSVATRRSAVSRTLRTMSSTSPRPLQC